MGRMQKTRGHSLLLLIVDTRSECLVLALILLYINLSDTHSFHCMNLCVILVSRVFVRGPKNVHVGSVVLCGYSPPTLCV